MPDDGLGDPLERVEPPRDRWGRVLLPGDDGKNRAYTRATTLAKALSGDKPALTMWKIRLAMHGVVANRTLHNLVAVTPLAEKEALNEIAERALAFAGADDGRTRGSTLHTACARARAVPGSFDALPDDLKADVRAYAHTLTAAGVELDVSLTERMVVNDAVMSAGSFDNVVTVKGLPGRYVFDLKTAQDLSYLDAQEEIEIQLGVYANANAMVPTHWRSGKGRAQLEPMPEGISKRWAIVAHLPAGSGECTLHWVNIARGWGRAKLAFEARKKGTGFVAWGLKPPVGDGWPVAPEGFDATVTQTYIESVHAGRDAAAVAVMAMGDERDPREIANAHRDEVVEGSGVTIEPRELPAAPPKRKRRSRAEIERDNAAKAAAAMPALDVAGGDRATIAALEFVTEPVPDPSGQAFVAVEPGVYAFGASGGALVDPGESGVSVVWGADGSARTGESAFVAAVAAEGFTLGGGAKVDGEIGEKVTVGGIEFTRIGNDPFPPPLPPGSLARSTDDEPDPGTPGRIDVSDAALDRSLAARDIRVRDEILAERKRIRIAREIRAAIDDATKPGTPRAQAQKHLALAWKLWESDWADEHTEYGKARLAAL